MTRYFKPNSHRRLECVTLGSELVPYQLRTDGYPSCLSQRDRVHPAIVKRTMLDVPIPMVISPSNNSFEIVRRDYHHTIMSWYFIESTIPKSNMQALTAHTDPIPRFFLGMHTDLLNTKYSAPEESVHIAPNRASRARRDNEGLAVPIRGGATPPFGVRDKRYGHFVVGSCTKDNS